MNASSENDEWSDNEDGSDDDDAQDDTSVECYNYSAKKVDDVRSL